MQKSSKYLFGLSSRSLLWLMVFSGMLLMAGCSGNPLKLLLGSGPNVAANTQVGQTNTQTVGQTNLNAPKVSVRPNARVDTVDQSTKQTTNQELPTWVWIVGIVLFIVGWVTDTPATYIKSFRRKK